MNRFFVLVSMVATFGAASVVQATVFASRPFDEIVGETPVIVRGRVEKSAPAWVTSKSGAKRIYTFTDVTITDVVKGEVKTKTLKFREIGGEVDGVGLDIVGAAKFKDGEDVVLMLDQNTSGVEPGAESKLFNLRGLMMGKLFVVKDENGNDVLKGPALASETAWSMDRLRQTVAAPPKVAPSAGPTKLVFSHGEPGEEPGMHAHEGQITEPKEEESVFGEKSTPRDARARKVLYVLLAAFIIIRTLRRSQKKKREAEIK